MPIDPRLILGGVKEAVRINTPFENLKSVMEAQDAQSQAREREAKALMEQRKARDAMIADEVIRQSGGDFEIALPELRRRAPNAAISLEKALGEARKERAAALKNEIDADAALTDKWIGRLRGLPEGDDELYQLYRERITREMPDLGAQLPPTYDKAALDRVQQVGLTAKEYAELQRQALEFAAGGKWRESTGAALATATSAEDWEKILAGQKELGAPKAVLAQFGPWAPDAPARAQRLGMTASQQSTADNQALTNDRLVAQNAAAAEERAIDNKRADAQLGISQAQLGLSRQRVAQAERTAAKGPTLSPTAESNIINRLSNQWTAATKTTRELDRSIGLMETGLAEAKRGNLNAGSQAVLVTFQKILDPTSVVRETEYDRSAAGQSLMNRVAGAMERLAVGGTGIRLDELEQFAQLARQAAQSQKGAIEPIRERIGKTADRYSIPRELVVEGAAPAEKPETGAAPAAPAAGVPSYADYLKRKRGGR